MRSRVAFPTALLSVVRYCAEEVERQQDAPSAVGDMVEAWDYALELSPFGPPNDRTILHLGKLVKPGMNADGFRRVPVRVGPHLVRVRADDIERCLENVCEAVYCKRLTPEDGYREFEEIHPFLDGNGRVGKILFNWWRGTLDAPELPPNFFGVVNL